MSNSGSVTNWIGQLQAGDREAAQKLWERYFCRLVFLARQKLAGAPRRAADEEDVALSAFDSFCRGAERGRFPQMTNRDNLWQLLMVITARKACHLLRHETRPKRGGGAVLGESAFDLDDSTNATGGIEQVIGKDPTPDFAAQVAEECRRLLDQLDDQELVSIAVWKLEGYTNEEIAEKLKCVPRTVERKLRVIRGIWGNSGAS